MKVKWKIIISLAVLVVLGIGLYASTVYSKKGLVSVQTGQVVRQDLTSIVTASGEIKPKNYINIGANAQGDITELLVKEGDHVRKGQLLAKIEDVQPEADVQAQRAAVSSAEAQSAASEAAVGAADENIKTMQAALEHDKADLDRMKADYQRAEQLFNEKLGAKQDFEMKKYVYDAQVSAIAESQARVVQAKAQREQTAAQLASAQRQIAQSKANLTRFDDILRKHNAYAPIDGVVTNLPVRMGESVVPGIQNSEGSTIMTIADMSVITAEVKVDETDIVNIQLGQVADITIDAIPNKVYKGHVTEIGNTAILRSTGVAASQSAISSQEAKDFKVVIAMDNPPDEVRPGLSCTAKITTATRANALDDSDSGAHRAAEGRSRAAARARRSGGGEEVHAGGREGPQGRSTGRLCGGERQGHVPQSGHRHHRRDRYRSAERLERERPDRDRHLSSDSHDSQ